jgi:cytochrome c553
VTRLSRNLAVVTIAFAFAALSLAIERPDWAYPVNAPGSRPAPDDGQPQRVPDSTVALTRTQIAAIATQVPDWHPNEHPAMPVIVGNGRAPQVFACGYCHLPNGAGRPENASLAGLTVAYIKQQMLAFRNGERPGSEPARLPQTIMVALAKNATDAEIAEAAAYFAALKPASFVKVVEAATVPKTVVAGWMLTRAPGTDMEPIGNRIIEIAEDFERFEKRDSRTPYIAYVPVGSLKRGADLVATGGGKTLPCSACHGPQLHGQVDIPRLAGRSPGYLMRQLYDLQHGTRKGQSTELMQLVVANLTEEDRVALAAYLASLVP